MKTGTALRLALRIVALASALVPRGERAAWRQEWEAELRHRWGHLGRRRRLTWRTGMDLVRRSLGSLPDAAWIRRQFTADADLVHDVRHAVRLLAKTPGFAAVALIVFAVGIGATTAMASLGDVLLFRPLPVPDAGRVVTLWERNRATPDLFLDVSPGNAIDWIERSRSFSAIAAVQPWSLDYTGGDEPEVILAARVSRGFFEVLGVPLLHGRGFRAEEFARGKTRVVVLSHGFWQARLGSDRSIIGRAISLDGEPHTVVGVLPPGLELRLLQGGRERAVWLPEYFNEDERQARTSGYWNVVARVKPDVTVEQARAEMDRIAASLAEEYPSTNANTGVIVLPLRAHLAGSLRTLLPLLLGAVVVVLLAACANVANLLIARAVFRTREFAVRQALGAGRGRLVRQMLAESLVLALAGGALGLIVARWSLSLIASLRPEDVARIDRIPLDARAAAIAFALTLVAAVLAGLAPAIDLLRRDAASGLREAVGPGPGRRRLRAALAAAEIALALLLLVGGGLLVRSFVLIQRVDPGFAPAQVMALQVFAWDRNQTPAKRALFFERALERMRALPGVAAAGIVSAMPFIEANINIETAMAIAGRPPAPRGEGPSTYVTAVGGDYFRAMGIPLRRGRLFEPADRSGSRIVFVISDALARQYWPGQDALGAKVRLRFTGTIYEGEIVGIVGEVRHDALDQPSRPELFFHHPQAPFGSMTFVIRTVAGSPVTMQALKEQVWAIDPLQAFYRTATLEELVDRTLVGRRFGLVLIVGFAGVALLLAAAGLYGVISSSTSQRTREFGVRIALGAGRREIVRLVVGEGLRLAAVGLAIGVAAALWLTRLLQSLLFGVTPTDPLTFVAVGGVIVSIALVSCYLPARRAIRIDPLAALRSE